MSLFLNCAAAETHAIQISPSQKAHFQLDFNHFHLKILPPFVRKTPDVFPVGMKPIHLNQWKTSSSGQPVRTHVHTDSPGN